MKSRTVTTLVPWFGGNRRLAERVGEELTGAGWLGVPFAGGMPELQHVDVRTIVVSDLHRHVINLARVLSDERTGRRLIRELRRECYHSDTLAEAQKVASTWEGLDNNGELVPNYHAAKSYFISQWMGRSGLAGTDGEFRGKLPVRWNGNGGDSCRRYRSACESLLAWRRIMHRCNFLVMDVFAFLDRVEDKSDVAVYLDPPFPGDGDSYKHKFDLDAHRRLAATVTRFTEARVLLRFYDKPLIRELYGAWNWRFLSGGRDQHGQTKPEVLICNGQFRGKAEPTEAASEQQPHDGV